MSSVSALETSCSECYCSGCLAERKDAHQVVHVWSEFLEKAHTTWQTCAPFSWLAYRSILATGNSDLADVMEHTSSFVTIFFSIKTSAFSSWIYPLFFIPICADVAKLSTRGLALPKQAGLVASVRKEGCTECLCPACLEKRTDVDRVVRIWSDTWDRVHQLWQRSAPFSWLAYRTILPDENATVVDLVDRICSFATVFFFFTTYVGAPWAYPLFFLPLGADLVQMVVHFFTQRKSEDAVGFRSKLCTQCLCLGCLSDGADVHKVVRVWSAIWDKVHASWQEYAPFSWLAYRSILPNCNSDLVGLMGRVGFFVPFFFLRSFLPSWIYLLLLLPFSADLARIFSNPLTKKTIEAPVAFAQKYCTECLCLGCMSGRKDINKVVRTWSFAWQKVHRFWQDVAPFSWIVYRSILPNCNSEMNDLRKRVALFAAIFFFVRSCPALLRPWTYLLAFTPFIADAVTCFANKRLILCV